MQSAEPNDINSMNVPINHYKTHLKAARLLQNLEDVYMDLIFAYKIFTTHSRYASQYIQKVETSHKKLFRPLLDVLLFKDQWFYRCFHPAIIAVPVIIRIIDIELHFVAVRISQVDTLTDSMIR